MAPPSGPSRSRDLLIRTVSALVMVPVAIAAVLLGGPVFYAFMIAGALLAVREWVRLAGPGGADVHVELSHGFVLAAILVFALIGLGWALPVLAALTAVMFLLLWRAGATNRLLMSLGVPYVGVAFVAMLWLRSQPEDGIWLLLWLAFVVWSTDVGGYAAGRLIGGPKLAPAISPGKTWAGLGGAVLLAAVMGWIMAWAFGAAVPLAGAPVAAVLAVVAQGGDLFESALKRHVGVKDSGTLIPGHGGILDRIDGLVAAAPVFALFELLVGRGWGWF